MKNILIGLGFICCANTTGWSQYDIDYTRDLDILKKLPQEKVYVNHTGPVVFSGDYIYFSFQCFNAQNSRPSSFSKLGYVTLVNKKREHIFEQKILLDSGRGQGEFFVSTNIPSGVYKLLGYTQWMKNNGIEQVFKDDIVIINPYLVDQTSLLFNSDKNVISEKKEVGPIPKVDSSVVGITLKKTLYRTREKVQLGLKNYKGYLGNGTYSIKVREKSRLSPKTKMNAISFAKDYLNVDKVADLKSMDSIFLPEQYGELLSGTVRDANTGQPLIDTPVIVSLPGKDFILKSVITDKEGNFSTYVREDYQESSVLLQIDDTDRQVDIELKSPRKLNLTNLEFADYTIDQGMANAIKLRSIYNQIENQYFPLKPDSVLLERPSNPFNSGNSMVFALDDYTRFSTFQETLIEILNIAGYRKNPKGNDYIRITQDFKKFNEKLNDFPALVLFDGVYISDHSMVKDYNAKKIKSISLIRDQFQLGNAEYNGIMYVETMDGDYFKDYNAQDGVLLTLNKPIPQKNYYVQSYDGSRPFERVPDCRTLLFWKPNVVIDGNGKDFQFFTSDITGEYEIMVDGFTTYGKPISFSRSITVK